MPRLKALSLFAATAVLAPACTSVPEPSGFLTDYQQMGPAKGLRGKRLSTPKTGDLEPGLPLVFDVVVMTDGVAVDPALGPKQKALLVNQFARSLCASLSKSFVISNAPQPGAYRLRAAITRVVPSGAYAVAATALTGLRPPIGLGALTAEMEIIEPGGQQAGAMVWSQDADVIGGGRVSTIGDSYDFAQAAAQDFGKLFAVRKDARPRGLKLGVDPDEACDVYGEESGVMSFGLGLIGIGAPPELSDKGRRAPDPADPAR